MGLFRNLKGDQQRFSMVFLSDATQGKPFHSRDICNLKADAASIWHRRHSWHLDWQMHDLLHWHWRRHWWRWRRWASLFASWLQHRHRRWPCRWHWPWCAIQKETCLETGTGVPQFRTSVSRTSLETQWYYIYIIIIWCYILLQYITYNIIYIYYFCACLRDV